MTSKLRSIFITTAAWLFPVLVFAQQDIQQDIPDVIDRIGNIINNAVIPLLIALAFVYFLYGVFKYISSATTEGKESGRGAIIYGLIGLFVMLAAWGLVNLLLKTFFIGENLVEPPEFPGVPGFPSS